MDEIKDVRELIRLKWETLTPIQKRIANYILENFEEISIFLNAKSLAEDLNVSRAAITRFANALGFSGVLALNKNLKEFAKVWMTPSQRFSKRRNSTDKEDSLWVTFDQDIRNLERTLKNIDRSVFLKVADAISKANTIYIIGLGDAASLSWLLSFQLSLIFDDVRSITRADMVLLDLRAINDNDLLLIFSYPRYSEIPKEAAEFAKQKGSTVITISDSYIAPSAQKSDHVLIVENETGSFFNSCTAASALIHALVKQVSVINRHLLPTALKNREHLFKYFKIFK